MRYRIEYTGGHCCNFADGKYIKNEPGCGNSEGSATKDISNTTIL